jgi:hypothetical protein
MNSAKVSKISWETEEERGKRRERKREERQKRILN